MATRKKANTTTQPDNTQQATTAPAGRVVANPARPSRQGYSTQLANLASQYGWALVPVSDPSPEIVHIYANAATPAKGGAVLTHPNGNVLRVSLFATKGGESDRLDAAYLWQPGTTQGKRVQTCYQVAATLANQGAAVAPPEMARKRTQAQPVAAPATTAPAPAKAKRQPAKAKATKAA